MTLDRLNSLLKEMGVHYHKYTHPPLHTSHEADRLELNRSGQRLKNLFLKDNYGRRHFLLLVSPEKQVDLKQLSKQMKVSRLGFASERRLLKYLNVKPGCVSLLALINDQDNDVELLIDREVANADSFQCHPLINTQTYVLSRQDTLHFLSQTQHTWQAIEVPGVRMSQPCESK